MSLNPGMATRLLSETGIPPAKLTREFIGCCDEGAAVRRLEAAVTAIGSDDKFGFGPCTMKRPCAFHGTDDIVTALHDHCRNLADPRSIAQQLIIRFRNPLLTK